MYLVVSLIGRIALSMAVLIFLLVTSLLFFHSPLLLPLNAEPLPIREARRADFPPGFVFGTASSAYQYEGAVDEGGRKPSIWDTFSQVPGNVIGSANGNVAVDEYHLYEEDIALMSSIGMDAYRVSISWSRLYPEGNGQLNEAGISHYNNLIDSLLAKGIQPYVTIYHWDLPQKLQDSYEGWLSSKIVEDYANFASTCFEYFGDRVKHWITFNEPTVFITDGFNDGTAPPQRCSPWVGNCTAGDSATEPYIAQHNFLLAHAAAVQIYRENYQKQQNGRIGMTLNIKWYVPLSNTTEDAEAVGRLLDFTFGWHLRPLLYGEYPAVMQELVGDRLPKFTAQQKRQLINSLDFLGINYYTTKYVRHVDTSPNPSNTSFYQDTMTATTGERNGVPIGPQGGSSRIYIYPKGLMNVLMYIKETYPTVPPLFITENGVDEKNNESLPLREALNDPVRIEYYRDHLFYLLKAIKKGVDVQGFFAWSLLDNFEWTSGYDIRFGLFFVDYATLKRYPKRSAHWFQKILAFKGREWI